jgi:signal transduction histidine kinase
MRDTCERADLDFFAFVDPSCTMYVADNMHEHRIRRPSLTNIYTRLMHQPYEWGYIRGSDGKRCLAVVRPLLLDDYVRMGKRTVRFYQVFLQHGARARAMDILTPDARSVRSLPLAIIGLPIADIQAITRQAVLHMLALGLILFVLSSALIYISISIQQHRITALALAQARAENVRLLDGLRRSDRLATLGRVAAAMAHELRNPLSSIRGFGQLFRKHAVTEKDPTLRQYADMIVGEVDRLNGVITTMLKFSRPIEVRCEPSDVRSVINHLLRLVHADAKHRNITLCSHVASDVPPVMMDTNLMTQALLNLLINALDAMPQGGNLTIDVTRTATQRVSIAVRDTGTGFSREHLSQIFQPYFTTKPTGTGLGLATVDKIVAEHGGRIRVESALGKGTVFYIELPLAKR